MTPPLRKQKDTDLRCGRDSDKDAVSLFRRREETRTVHEKI